MLLCLLQPKHKMNDSINIAGHSMMLYHLLIAYLFKRGNKYND